MRRSRETDDETDDEDDDRDERNKLNRQSYRRGIPSWVWVVAGLGGTGLIGCAVVLGMAVMKVRDAARHVEEKAAVVAEPPADVPVQAAPPRADKPRQRADKPREQPLPVAGKGKWAADGVEVQVVTVVQMPNTGGPNDIATPLDGSVTVAISVLNTSRTRVRSCLSWGPGNRVTLIPAYMTDEFGTRYDRVSLPIGMEFPGEFTHKSLHPGENTPDFVVFERPVAECKVLTLTLPAANIGEAGEIRFKIPRETITQSKASVPNPPAQSKPAPVTPAPPSQTGTVHLTSRVPVAAGVEAWVWVDGKKRQQWPVGVSTLDVQLPPGQRTIEVRVAKPVVRVLVKQTVDIQTGKTHNVAVP